MARVEDPEVFEGRYVKPYGKTVLSLVTGQSIALTPGETYTVEVGSHDNVYIDGAYVGDVDDFTRVGDSAECRHCHRQIVNDPTDGWVDATLTPEDGDDYDLWRETCDAHDTFEARHEPIEGSE